MILTQLRPTVEAIALGRQFIGGDATGQQIDLHFIDQAMNAAALGFIGFGIE